MRLILGLLFFAVTLVGPSHAKGQTMFGSPDCGQWLADRASHQKSWLLGFLSGLNVAIAEKNFDPLDRLNSADQAFAWMDNYCRNNPLKLVSAGAAKLYEELQHDTRRE